MRKNQRRAMVCNAAKRSGFTDPRQVAALTGKSLTEVADALIAVQDQCRAELGGVPRYTGNNRVYRCGVVAYQVRCKACGGLYWVTGVPEARCVDCR